MAFPYQKSGETQGAFDAICRIFARLATLDTLRTDLKTERGLIVGDTEEAELYELNEALRAFDNIDQAVHLNSQAIANATGHFFIRQIGAEELLEAMRDREQVIAMVRKLREFMITDSQTLNDCTVAATVAYGAPGHTNTGDGVGAVGIKDRTGAYLANARPEKLTMRCTADAQGPRCGILAGEEVFEVSGKATKPNLCHEWLSKGGSGLTGRMTSIALARQRGVGPGKNIVSNGTMQAFVTNVPSYWGPPKAGTPGTHILECTDEPYVGTKHLKLVGDAIGTKPSLPQPCDGASATLLRPARPYLIGPVVRYGTGLPTAGALRLSFQDGAGTILNTLDPCASTVDCTALTAAYVWYATLVWTPYLIPAATEIILETSTALGDTENIYVGGVAIAEASDLWAQDPKLAIIGGATPWVKGDTIAATITNNRTMSHIITWLDRVWDIHGMRLLTGEPLLLPTATGGAETIPDSLIA